MEVKVIKTVPTEGHYGTIFDVALPVRFYFNKDGSFDGIEVHVEGASERDIDLIRDLCDLLAKATGIKYAYDASEETNDKSAL